LISKENQKQNQISWAIQIAGFDTEEKIAKNERQKAFLKYTSPRAKK
jgi:hypothetical protein